MFYFLILTGSALILFGRYSRKKQRAAGHEPKPQAVTKLHEEASGPDGFEALRIRMDQVEKLVFQSLMVQEGRKAVIRNESSGTDAEADGMASDPETEEVTGVEAHSAGAAYPALEVAAHAEPDQAEGLTERSVIDLERSRPEEGTPKKKPMPDNIRAIVDYEKQGLSVQEIAKVTRMKKGEVLLLKNLSKHYFK